MYSHVVPITSATVSLTHQCSSISHHLLLDRQQGHANVAAILQHDQRQQENTSSVNANSRSTQTDNKRTQTVSMRTTATHGLVTGMVYCYGLISWTGYRDTALLWSNLMDWLQGYCTAVVQSHGLVTGILHCSGPISWTGYRDTALLWSNLMDWLQG